MISVIHPSRLRAAKAAATWRSWIINNIFGEMEWILSLDEDDNSPYNAYFDTSPIKLIRNKNKSAVEAINNAARIAIGDILIVVSDDTDCGYNGWDAQILDAVKDRSDYLLRVDDGIQKRTCTMPIMDRAYYNRFGYIYNPIYTHSFADTELTEVAYILGRIIVRNDLKFPHLHYSVTGEQPDELYLRNDKTHDPGREIFKQRQKINFGL
jgi:hypothetical protein